MTANLTEQETAGAPTLVPAILVVDDRDENLVAMGKLLCGLEAELLTVPSGQQMLEIALSRNDIALILLDVQMPGMDGFEAAELLRLNNSTQSIPIIFVTAACHEAQHIFQGYECGAVDFLPKPIQEHVLQSKVRVFLELHRKQAALEESRAELERSNGALQDFAHSAAHDLQAPLRHIRFGIQVVLEESGKELTDEVIGELEKIDTCAERMQDLTSGLLAYARLGGSQPATSPVALNGVLEVVLSEFADVVAETSAVVDIGDAPDVLGDRVLLHQLFQNLLSNALKYRKPDVAPRIQVQCERVGQEDLCHISITDNGIGLDPSHADRIFEPFRRLVTSSEFEGSGIGMATAKRIVELHGGTISASGELGQGATFEVTLPLPKPASGSESKELALEPIRLLIVDDSPMDLDITERLLTPAGFDVLIAGSAKEALGMLEADRVDVILSDYQMPSEDGIWLLERIKEQHPQVRRLLTSSVSPLCLEENKESSTVEGFFPKTVTAKQLQDFLRSSRQDHLAPALTDEPERAR